MKKLLSRFLLLVAAVAIPAGLLAANVEAGSWTGWITDSNCAAKGAKAEHKACAERCVKGGAKWALYNPADKQVYVLSNQQEAAKMAAQEVTVKGKLDKEKKEIEVSSIEPAAKK